MYSRPGARHCNVVFRAASQRADFVSNVRKIVNHLPIDDPYSMGEFKALQAILDAVLDSFRKRFEDESAFHVAALTFTGDDIWQALSSKPVKALIRERFPKLFERRPSVLKTGSVLHEDVAEHPENVVSDLEKSSPSPIATIAAKFLQYGIMKDRSGSNSRTRLIFRKLGLYRFSMSGLGTIFDICIATWNVGEKKPPPPDQLRRLLRPGAEIYAIGLQECEHKAKWVTAIENTVGAKADGSSNGGRGGDEGEHGASSAGAPPSPGRGDASGNVDGVKQPGGAGGSSIKDYKLIHVQSMWGIHLVVLARSHIANCISKVEGTQEATGLGHIMGNKGGCAVIFTLFTTTRIGFFHVPSRCAHETPSKEG
jgi:hypothetical protein